MWYRISLPLNVGVSLIEKQYLSQRGIRIVRHLSQASDVDHSKIKDTQNIHANEGKQLI